MAKPNHKQEKSRVNHQAAKPTPAKAMEGFTLMRFSEPKFYNGELIYDQKQVVEVPNDMVDRWIRRGGVVINSKETLAEVEAHEKAVVEKQKELEQEASAGQDKQEDAPKFLDPQGSEDEDL